MHRQKTKKQKTSPRSVADYFNTLTAVGYEPRICNLSNAPETPPDNKWDAHTHTHTSMISGSCHRPWSREQKKKNATWCAGKTKTHSPFERVVLRVVTPLWMQATELLVRLER